jgi:uncharacterized protein DUF397
MNWKKSSYSTDSFNCVEVSMPEWRKSSASTDSCNCVEVAMLDSGKILVRDDRGEDSPILRFTPAEWGAFLAGVRNGEFDS